MFGIEIIEVALGLALTYFAVSTICSGIYEAFAQITDKRAKHLEEGLRKFLNDEKNGKHQSGLVDEIYNHPQIWSRLEGKIGKKTWIEGKKFSSVLFDILVPKDEAQGAEFVNKLKSEIGKTIENPAIQKSLKRIVSALEVPNVSTLKHTLEAYMEGNSAAAKLEEVFKGINLEDNCKDCKDEILTRFKTANLVDSDYAIACETLDSLLKGGDKFANVKTLIRLHMPDGTLEKSAINLVSKWEDNERIVKFRKKFADRIKDDKIQKVLLQKIDAAEGKVEKVRETLESIFDDAMSDVGKWYRVNVRAVILGLSILITLGFNVDSLELSTKLWNDNDLRAASLVTVTQVIENRSETWTPGFSKGSPEAGPGFGSSPTNDTTSNSNVNSQIENTSASPDKVEPTTEELLKDAQKAIDKMETLPIGWNFDGDFWDVNFNKGKTGKKLWAAILLKLLGFAMTIAAASLGAPFWFELLKNLSNIKAQLTKK